MQNERSLKEMRDSVLMGKTEISDVSKSWKTPELSLIGEQFNEIMSEGVRVGEEVTTKLKMLVETERVSPLRKSRKVKPFMFNLSLAIILAILVFIITDALLGITTCFRYFCEGQKSWILSETGSLDELLLWALNFGGWRPHIIIPN